MAENLAVVLVGSTDLSTRNDGAGQGGTQQVAVLVDAVAWPDVSSTNGYIEQL